MRLQETNLSAGGFSVYVVKTAPSEFDCERSDPDKLVKISFCHSMCFITKNKSSSDHNFSLMDNLSAAN